jgi:small subunit ribosomal protein S8
MDTIANMLTIIRNGQAVKKETVSIPYSSVKEALAEKMVQAGFLKGVEKKGKKNKKIIDLNLAYTEKGEPMIHEIKRISKPSKRVYTPVNKLKTIRGGFGIQILSTSKGIMTDKEAKKEKVGGEVICIVH